MIVATGTEPSFLSPIFGPHEAIAVTKHSKRGTVTVTVTVS